MRGYTDAGAETAVHCPSLTLDPHLQCGFTSYRADTEERRSVGSAEPCCTGTLWSSVRWSSTYSTCPCQSEAWGTRKRSRKGGLGGERRCWCQIKHAYVPSLRLITTGVVAVAILNCLFFLDFSEPIPAAGSSRGAVVCQPSFITTTCSVMLSHVKSRSQVCAS